MRPSKHEEFVYMGNGSKVKVEFFGMIKLRLATKIFVLLHDVAYIPSLRRNLISVSVLGIKILRDRANGVLKLSQRAYIERILKRFNMHNCKSTKAPIVKGDKFSKAQCPQNDDEREEMRTIPYHLWLAALCMLMYVHALMLLLLWACWEGT